MINRAFHQLCKKLLCLFDTIKCSIIPNVYLVQAFECGLAVEHIEHADRQIELVRSRLAARHVEFDI